MKQQPIAIRIWRSLKSDHTSILIITLSVQGLVVAAQFLAAVFVEPDVLGRIRWLESIFAIALLATSCGMPSIVFRQAAFPENRDKHCGLVIAPVLLTTFASLILIMLGLVVWATSVEFASKLTEPALLLMAFALIPANATRISIAVAVAAQLSKELAWKLCILSCLSLIGLAVGASMANVLGWALLRLTVETTIALFIWKLFWSGVKVVRPLAAPTVRRLYELFHCGVAANYAFLIRVLADNLPLLLLPFAGAQSKEVGLYGFANLLLFMPLLFMGTFLQSRLPSLIVSIRDERAFQGLVNAISLNLSRKALAWSGVILIISWLLSLGWGFSQYTGAAAPLAILCLGLPARALVLVAGAAAVAHGWFAKSSILAITEIVVVVTVLGLGSAKNAFEMAVSATFALWVAVLPAWWIIASAKKACR
jgi:hypothetical protein